MANTRTKIFGASDVDFGDSDYTFGGGGVADRWWKGIDTDWENTANWSTTEGGAGGASVPTSSDNAYFSATSGSGDCTLSATSNCAVLLMTAAATGGTDDYPGTFDANDQNININGDVVLFGDIAAGAGTWTVAGNFDNDGCTSYDDDISLIVLTGTGKTLTSNNTNELKNITIDGGSITAVNPFLSDGVVTIINSGTLSIPTGVTFTLGANADLIISSTGTNTLTGLGTLKLNLGAMLSEQSGTIDVAVLDIRGAHTTFAAGTYACGFVDFRNQALSTTTVTFASGTYNFTGASGVQFINTNAAGSHILDMSTNNPVVNITGPLVMNKVAGTLTFTTGNGAKSITGNVTLVGNVTFGSDTWSIAGNFDCSAMNKISGTEVMTMTGTGKTFTGGTSTATRPSRLIIDTGATITTTSSSQANVYECLGQHTLIGALFTVLGDVDMGAAGVITGTGTLRLLRALGSTFTGHATATIDCASITFSREATINSNGMTLDTNVVLDQTAASNYTITIADDMIVTGNLSIEANSGAVYTIDNSANPNITVSGNFTISTAGGTINYLKGTGTITKTGAGSGTQTWNFYGKNVEAIIINDAGSTTQFTGSFTTSFLTVTAGIADFQEGFTSGDFTAEGTVIFDPSKGYDISNPAGAGILQSESPPTVAYINYTGDNDFVGTLQYVVLVDNDNSIIPKTLLNQLKNKI